MKKDIRLYTKRAVHGYFESIITLIFFFPYFFSFIPLLKTLFYPWKHIVTKKEIRGFSLTEYFNRLLLNVMSSLIGATMRFSLLSFCFFFEIGYILSLPFITCIYFCVYLPFQIGIYLLIPTDEEIKEKEKRSFLTYHCLKQENINVVSEWFEEQWKNKILSQKWWDKKTLFSYPPLARDWAVGYTPTLDAYVEDLTDVAYQSTMHHIVGRKNELAQMQEVLTKSEEANIILVGEEGVGKRTVVDALARLIYEGQTGKDLAYKRILKLNMEKILTTFTDLKQRELFFEELLEEATEAKSVILLLENIDAYCSSGEGRIDLTVSLEKFAKHPTLQFIGITTPFFYQRFIFPNEKINRLFTRVDVKEISKQDALATILHIIPTFEQKYLVSIPYETAWAVIEKSEFYITYIPFPEKAIELLDQTVAHYNTEKKKVKSALILPEYVDIVLSEKTHIPTRLTTDMRTKLLQLEALLQERVLFQTNAISALSSALRRSFILLGKRKKPLATFLFLGPTGVGKTETAKALASLFFNNESYLTRFDMSLYQSKEDIKTLIGSLEAGLSGLLTQAIREKPYTVLLLDELEKAHPDLLNIFLTVIDEGYFTDGFGKRVDCKNLIIIGTSNAGADYMYKQQQLIRKISQVAIGSIDSQAEGVGQNLSQEQLIDYLIQNKVYSPEFLNRFDGVVMFDPISDSTLLVLAKKMSSSIQNTIYSLYKISIVVKDETLIEIIKKHYNPTFGARNLEHVVTQEIEDKIAILLLENKIGEGQTLTL
jgi:ATP-dependent Clp protease ATP-binding subunit ClpC